MSERLARTVRWMMMAAGLAAAGGAGAGDDLKNIGIGAGIGILGQIVQGKTITLESALGSAVGAGIGSQIGELRRYGRRGLGRTLRPLRAR